MSAELEKLLTPADLSELLGVPIATLHRWRYLGTGPRPLKVGRHLRWQPAVVAAWLEKQSASR